ncbi:MAG: hypothetical protein HEQ23_16545 [Tepidisphaera sp.]
MSISRRHFVQSAGTAAAVALLGKAPAARASNKSGLGPVLVGSGEHTYECIHDWAVLPKTHAFGNCHGVAFDAQGRCHIKHTVHSSSQTPDAMCVFDPEGKFIRSWAPEYKGGAHGLSIAKEKESQALWLADCNRGVVQKTDLDGKLILDFAWPEASGCYANKGEYKPTNVAVVPAGSWGPGGDVYVADGYGKSWIHRYNAKGEYQNSFGGPGKERGQVSCPHGIVIDTRSGTPTVLVADRSNRRLQSFSLDGRHLGFVTDELRLPCHFDIRGDVLLVPDLEARVTLLDKSNKLLAHLGDGGNGNLRGEAREKFIPGKFICPHSAAFDKDGNIFVVEWVEVGRVTKLKKI